MIVGYLYTVGAAILPNETDPPLVVDPYAVLTFPIPLEGFQMVARRYGKVAQGFGRVDLSQLALGDSLDVGREPPGAGRGRAVRYPGRKSSGSCENYIRVADRLQRIYTHHE
jgi:hypothetical protein